MLVIKGGHVLDPGHLDGIYDIYIENDVITALVAVTKKGNGAFETPDPDAVPEMLDPGKDVQIIDAAGKLVTPGLVDMHVHLREPGHEYKETIFSGTRAATAGGFSAVCCMPNTVPANDTAEVTRFILRQAELAGNARVYPVAAVSRGLDGKALSDFGELKEAGAVALTDDGRPVADAQLMRRAMEYALGVDLPIIAHSEELSLVGKGVMNEGPTATRLGLAGIPNAAEAVMVLRDIALCALTGAALHVAHVSTAESVAAIRAAKKQGVRVSAETAPHYFTLTDADVGAYDTHAKMNPPLRSEKDRDAIREGLADGTLDAIATDHAPHSVLEKAVEFDRAANGIIGLETALPLALSLVHQNILTLADMVAKLTHNPSRIVGLPCGIRVGAPADLTLIDPDAVHTFHSDESYSMSRNTPFDGREMRGRVLMTLVGGRVAHALDTNHRQLS